MKRLTWKRSLDSYEDIGLKRGVTEGDAIHKLSDYEDTGLEPEEIKLLIEMRKELTIAEKNGTI